MRRRWLAWTGGLALLGLLGLMPLRIALGWSDLERIGFSARQVAGTIWHGRIGELTLRSQPLGTMEVSLEPLPVLIGDVSLQFARIADPDGPLEGRLVAGLSRGLVATTGRIATESMFAPVPIAALELQNVSAVFRNGRCMKARGLVTPVLAATVPGASFGRNVSGQVQCDGERARVIMESPAKTERINLYVQASGDYRAWISVRTTRPEVSGALAALGFKPSADGMTLSVDGRL